MRREKLGFTLIEVLVVIFIIGLLASVMGLLMVTSSDTTSASVLISDLRNAKTAGFLWFIDNTDSSDLDLANEWNSANMPTNLAKYIESDKLLRFACKYVSGVGYLIGEPDVSPGVINKAISQAGQLGRSLGILLDENGDTLIGSSGSEAVFVLVKK